MVFSSRAQSMSSCSLVVMSIVLPRFVMTCLTGAIVMALIVLPLLCGGVVSGTVWSFFGVLIVVVGSLSPSRFGC